MTTSKQRKLLIESMLSSYFDNKLKEKKFFRRSKSLKFKKEIENGYQEIEVHHRAPRYSDDSAIAHISILLTISFPEINELLKKICNYDTRLPIEKNSTIGIPCGFAGPERQFVDWSPINENDFSKFGQEMVEYLQSYAIPFFDDYQTPAHIANCATNNDDRLLRGSSDVLAAIAASVYCGNIDMAKRIAENSFSKKGSRIQFKSVFDYLESCE